LTTSTLFGLSFPFTHPSPSGRSVFPFSFRLAVAFSSEPQPPSCTSPGTFLNAHLLQDFWSRVIGQRVLAERSSMEFTPSKVFLATPCEPLPYCAAAKSPRSSLFSRLLSGRLIPFVASYTHGDKPRKINVCLFFSQNTCDAKRPLTSTSRTLLRGGGAVPGGRAKLPPLFPRRCVFRGRESTASVVLRKEPWFSPQTCFSLVLTDNFLEGSPFSPRQKIFGSMHTPPRQLSSIAMFSPLFVPHHFVCCPSQIYFVGTSAFFQPFPPQPSPKRPFPRSSAGKSGAVFFL